MKSALKSLYTQNVPSAKKVHELLTFEEHLPQKKKIAYGAQWIQRETDTNTIQVRCCWSCSAVCFWVCLYT